MNFMKFSCLIFYIALTLLSHSYADELLRKRFEAEAPVAWNEIGSLVQPLIGRVNQSTTPISGPTESQLSKSEYSFSICDGHQLLRMHQKSGKAKNTVSILATNPNYGFRIGRTEQPVSRNEPWFVVEITNPEKIAADILDLGGVITIFTTIDHQSFPLTVADNSFVLKSVEANKKNANWVDVSFKSNYKYSDSNCIPSGTVTLDPTHSWVVREYEVIQKVWDGSGTISGAVEYQDDDDFLIPIRSTKTYKFSDVGIARKTTLDFVEWNKTKTPSSEFYLSEFGIPEPLNASKVPLQTWHLAIVGVFLFLALGIVFRLLSLGRK